MRSEVKPSSSSPDSTFVLLLDDDPMFALIVSETLEREVRAVTRIQDALAAIADQTPLAFLLDIYLQNGECGLDIIAQLRERHPHLPMIALTADPDEDLIGQALALGANDFMHKPIRAKELRARLQARILEAMHQAKTQTIDALGLQMDRRSRTLSFGSKQLPLAQSQVALFDLFLLSPGTTVTRDAIKASVWGSTAVSDNTIDHKVSELRSILKSLSEEHSIKSVYRQGYKLVR